MRPTHLMLPLLLSSLVSAADVASGEPDRPKDLIAAARSVEGFDTLLAAVEAAGLTEVLRDGPSFTVLAPSDAAFAALPAAQLSSLLRPEAREQLGALLKRHVVAGVFNLSAALANGSVETLSGDTVPVYVEGGVVRFGDARLVRDDVVASNGVLRAIDTVLLPPAPAVPAPPSAVELIETAIDRGVPLFNDGQPAACTAIYEITAQSLRANPSVPLSAEARDKLGAAADVAAEPSARKRAWLLRSALDAAYLELVAKGENAAQPQRQPARAEAGKLVDDFSDADDGDSWRSVDDSVMGGLSASKLTASRDGYGVFAGTVSLENNGGFASVRRAFDRGDLEGYSRIAMRVRGDGRLYRLTATPTPMVTPDIFYTEFETVDGEWLELDIPIDSLERSIMGRKPRNARPIDPAKIRTIGFMIADKKTGAFKLEIDSIRVLR